MTTLCAFDARFAEQGYAAVCGIDEAGCGPLAGPVYAAAVILDPARIPAGLNDSKKVPEKRRQALYEYITANACAHAIAFCDHAEIDELNILRARLLAMKRAVEALSVTPDLALIDGTAAPDVPCQTLCFKGGDAKSASIAAASILAKVARDRHMREVAACYPQYGFERHKGYPTKAHYECLDLHGPCPVHRMSFLKKYFEKKL